MTTKANNRLIIFKPADSSADEFVDFWKSQYTYPNMRWYTENINLESFTRTDLYKLFCWKNGMRLSQRKESTFNRIISKIELINHLRNQFDEDSFSEHFGWITPVWQIFLKHVIQPDKTPIFDQHVYRAYRYLRSDSNEEKKAAGILSFFVTNYVPFFQSLHSDCSHHTRKEVDDALWSFGKFLTLYPALENSSR